MILVSLNSELTSEVTMIVKFSNLKNECTKYSLDLRLNCMAKNTRLLRDLFSINKS